MQKRKLIVMLSIAIVLVLCVGIAPALAQGQLQVAYADVASWSNSYSGSYYNNLNTSLTGAAFRSELANLITTTHTHQTTYKELGTVFKTTDADPNKNGNIIWFYTGTSVSFSGTFGSSVGSTNREHVWAKNSGDTFPAESGPGSDAHHLRPTEMQLNGKRSNYGFGEVAQTSTNLVKEAGQSTYGRYDEYGADALSYLSGGLFYPGKGYRGATARILFYMQVRWGDANSLYFVDGTSTDNGKGIGKISDLFKWHLEEPPTDEEIRRNEAVFETQGNRNPFIDHPEYAIQIYCNGYDSNSATLNNVLNTVGNPYDNSQPLESISVSPNTESVAVGATATLNLVKTPSNAAANITWSSSDTSVATVSSTGVVTGVSAGTATITATPSQQGVSAATATVTVKQITSISISGTPTKTAYTSGQNFDPTGLTVRANYNDNTFSNLALTDCQWLDGTTGNEALSAGTTTVTCKYGAVPTQTISGITVAEAQGGNATNCISTFTSSDLDVKETGALQYTSTGTPNSQMDSNRGVQYVMGSNQNGVVITSTTEAINATQVKVEVASNNDNGMTVAVKVGATTFTCTTSNEVKKSNSGANTIILAFTSITPVTGNVEITLTPKASKNSMYIKSVEVSGSGGGSVTPPNPSDSVTLNKTSLLLSVGGTETLTATPGTAGATVTWSSSNSGVATVSNGVVTAVSAGTATITATCGTATATCAVTVTEREGLSLNKTTASLIVGGSETLSATLTGGLTGTPTWTSSNSSVATVVNGVVSAVGEGSATITAQIGEISATCVVTVEHSLSMSTGTVVLKVGETHTVTDAVATGTISWVSSNYGIAMVENGVVTAVAEGSATITAICGNQTLSFYVVVSDEDIPEPETQEVVITFASGFETVLGTYHMEEWAQEPIAGKAYVYTASNKLQFNKNGGFLLNTVATTGGIVSIKLELSDGEISDWALRTANTAFLAEAGYNAPTGGTEQTNVVTYDNTAIWTLDDAHTFFTLNKSASNTTSYISKVTITFIKTAVVIPTPTDNVTLDKTVLTLDGVGATGKIDTMEPTSGTPVWTSSDSTVATVAQDGTVTAVGRGTATITATCGTATATCAVTVTVPYSISLDTTTLELTEGESETLVATANGDVTWTTSDATVATVANGVVTAVSAGTVTITATCGTETATCVVTVSEREIEDSVTLDKTTATVTVGGTATITATASGEATWTTSDETVATVVNGVITGVSAGTATITATCGTASATCTVTVTTEPVADDSVTLDASELTVQVGYSSLLTATATGTVSWSSSDESVAIVDNNSGRVFGIAAGTATITATCGTATATCVVTVTEREIEDSVTLDKTELTLITGQSGALTATASGTVLWSTSDKTVVVVDSKGRLIAVAEGTATITATCGTAAATCTVTVTNEIVLSEDTSAFVAAVAAIGSDATQETFNQIKHALELYAELSAEGKNTVSGSYADLQTAIYAYNLAKEDINNAMQYSALHSVLAGSLATFAALAVVVILKQKLL